jgi:hypothetical protein
MKETVLYIRGGIGNQLFQYAAAYSYAKKNDRNLVIDTGSYYGYRWSKDSAFVLDKFIFDLDIVGNHWWSFTFSFGVIGSYVGRVFRRFFWQHGNIYKEKELFVFDRFFLIKDNYEGVYGSFQSPLYFESYDYNVKSIFNLPLISEKSKEMRSTINSVESSVSIHYRDYGDPLSGGDDIKLLMGDVSNRYYEDAVSLIESNIKNPVYFVFSNNIESAKLKFKKLDIQIVYFDYKSDILWEDMSLMSLCKHNIICNSSYSWWSAYLNTNKNKIVIAPKNWGNFMNDRGNNNLFPEKWILL